MIGIVTPSDGPTFLNFTFLPTYINRKLSTGLTKINFYGVPPTHHLISIQTTPYSKQIANSSSTPMGHNYIT